MWCEGPVWSRTWRLPTPPLPLCPALVTHFAVCRFILCDSVTSMRSGHPRYGHQIYWVIEHGVGSWNFPVLDTWSNQEWLRITWLASKVRTVLSPQLAQSILTPWIWCQGSPDSLSLCFGSSGESWGQGTNESRTLHPEALSIYRYFQSSWQTRIVYQVGFDREVSCSDCITLMPCVLRQVIYSPHLNSR